MLTGELPFRKQGTGIAAGTANLIISPDQFTLVIVSSDNGPVHIERTDCATEPAPFDWPEPLLC